MISDLINRSHPIGSDTDDIRYGCIILELTSLKTESDRSVFYCGTACSWVRVLCSRSFGLFIIIFTNLLIASHLAAGHVLNMATLTCLPPRAGPHGGMATVKKSKIPATCEVEGSRVTTSTTPTPSAKREATPLRVIDRRPTQRLPSPGLMVRRRRHCQRRRSSDHSVI